MRRIILGIILICITISLQAGINDKYPQEEKDCDRGYVASCMTLARLHTEDNPQYSEDMYTHLCKNKITKACTEGGMIASLFPSKIDLHNEEIIHKIKKMRFFFSKACEYGGGCGNFVFSYTFICDVGDAESCYTSGRIYEEGITERINIATAKMYYSYACKYGLQKGCIKLDALKDVAY